MAGVIFKTERDTFKVIDQNGAVSTKTPRQISLRRDANRALAVDHDSQEIKVGDAVKEIDGAVSSNEPALFVANDVVLTCLSFSFSFASLRSEKDPFFKSTSRCSSSFTTVRFSRTEESSSFELECSGRPQQLERVLSTLRR